jgi:hypothetical protein
MEVDHFVHSCDSHSHLVLCFWTFVIRIMNLLYPFFITFLSSVDSHDWSVYLSLDSVVYRTFLSNLPAATSLLIYVKLC